MLGTTIAIIFRRIVPVNTDANKNLSARIRSALSMLLPAAALLIAPSANSALIPIVPSYPDITTSGSDISYVWTAGVGGTLTINGNAGASAAQVTQSVKFSSSDTTHSIYGCSTLGVSTTTCATPNSPNSFYSLTANFNSSGAFTGGTLTVLGYVDANTVTSGYQAYDWNGAAAGGAPTGTLIQANLTGFGFNGSAGTSAYDVLNLDFSYVLTSGDFLTGGYSSDGLKWNNGRVYSPSSTAPVGGTWTQTAFTQSFSCGNGNALQPCNATMDTFVPLPAAAWLFGSGLFGLLGIARRSRKVFKS